MSDHPWIEIWICIAWGIWLSTVGASALVWWVGTL